MIGKHFTIRALIENKPTRHYTICNVMEPSIYREVLKLLSDENSQLTKSGKSIQNGFINKSVDSGLISASS